MHSVHTSRSVQMEGHCGGVKVAGGTGGATCKGAASEARAAASVIICNGTDQGMERIATRVAPAAMLPQNLVTRVHGYDILTDHMYSCCRGGCVRRVSHVTPHRTLHRTPHRMPYSMLHAPCSIPHTPYPIHIPYPVLVENTDECSPPMPSRHALSRPWHLSMPPALDNE